MAEEKPISYAPGERRRLVERIAFAHYPAINVGTARRFEALGISPREFFSMDIDALVQITGVRRKVVEAMRDPTIIAKAEDEVTFMADHDVHPLWYGDEGSGYPRLLLECDDAPAMLYLLGRIPPQDAKIIAIVGTRHCTPYGQSFVNSLMADIAASLDNVIVVSGLALGADIAAHRAAMKEGITTGAVMAEGLNRVYPAEHRSDAVRIIREGGFLLTQYLSSDPTHKGHFLARNRIVAGMADVTIIVESDLRGGAMVTARLASDYHREVLALPGRISDRYSRGCNDLIFRNAARVVRDASDLIDTMCWTPTRRPGLQTSLQPELSMPQKVLMHFLEAHPEATVNDIAVAMDLPVNEISSRLFELEMDGFINAIAGGRYMVVCPVY